MIVSVKTRTFVSLATAALAIVALGHFNAYAVDFNPFVTPGPNMPPGARQPFEAGPVIPEIQFNNNDISMAFQIISDATGWSIFPSDQVGKAKISLWAKNVSANDLLDMVVTLAGFIYHRTGDIISVMTYDEYMQHYGLEREVIRLKYADATSISNVLKPFLTKLAKCVGHRETNTIVLYETQANLKLLLAMIAKLDTPADDFIFEAVSLKYADCESLAKILQDLFANQSKNIRNKSLNTIAADGQSQPKGTGDTPSSGQETAQIPFEQVQVYPVLHANQLVIAGTKTDVQKVKDIIAMVDVAGENIIIEVVELKYADAELVGQTLQQLFSADQAKDTTPQKSKAQPASRDKAPVSPEQTKGMLVAPRASVQVQSVGRTNQLIVKALVNDIEKIKHLISQLDIFIEPVTRNYHFIYVDAAQIYTGLERTLDIYARSGTAYPQGRQTEGSMRGSGLTLVERSNSILLTAPPSLHRIMTSICESIDVPGAYEAGMLRVYKIENADVQEIATTLKELLEQTGQQQKKQGEPGFTETPQKTPRPEEPKTGPKELTTTEEFVPQVEAKVSINKATNSVVVQATSRQHSEIEKLIKKLDVRRKQVLIEAWVVEVTTTDNLDLGVELNHAGSDAMSFTSYGLSTLDPATGVRDIMVSPGGTVAVLRPDKVQAILKALQTNANVRIESAPRILVNDNAVGSIASIAEEPTTQINQGQTTTTTSFAGFVQAGTQFAITPLISETDYLRVQYSITLNAFGAKSTDPSIPPPRSTSSIQSEATVPDGATIVVGGLQSTNERATIDKVPLLGDIPLIGLAFRNTIIKKQHITTYLFITTTIMKNTDFSDLRDATNKALKTVQKQDDNTQLQPGNPNEQSNP